MAEISLICILTPIVLKAAVIYRAVREGQTTLDAVTKIAGPAIAVYRGWFLRMAAISAATNPEKKVVLVSRPTSSTTCVKCWWQWSTMSGLP